MYNKFNCGTESICRQQREGILASALFRKEFSTMYTAKDIRNLALLGHGGDGKSALCESMLYVTKAITRLGKRADGTTVSDFDD